MDLNRVDLNLLVAFDALMAERSVTKAAARLSVGQPSMSATLARLRKLFDDPLLVRDGRTLVATPVAEALVRPVHETLMQVEGLLASRRTFDPARDARVFSVMASDYTTLIFLRPLLARLDEVAPHVVLEVRPVSGDFVGAVRRNETDLLIVPKQVVPTLTQMPHATLYSDRFVCVCDADNTQIGDTLTLEEFSRQRYLATTTGSYRSIVEQQLDELGVPRRTEITASFVLTPFLLSGTAFLTTLQERLALELRERANLRIVEPPVRLSPIDEVMIWTPRSSHDPAHTWLRGQIRSLAQEMASVEGAPRGATSRSSAPRGSAGPGRRSRSARS